MGQKDPYIPTHAAVGIKISRNKMRKEKTQATKLPALKHAMDARIREELVRKARTIGNSKESNVAEGNDIPQQAAAAADAVAAATAAAGRDGTGTTFVDTDPAVASSPIRSENLRWQRQSGIK
jgi:hypothetical protein